MRPPKRTPIYALREQGKTAAIAFSAESVHVVGPIDFGGRFELLCPVCDNDRVNGIPDDVQRACSSEWLAGQALVGAKGSIKGLTCLCFVTDPLEGAPPSADPKRRFFYYNCCYS